MRHARDASLARPAWWSAVKARETKREGKRDVIPAPFNYHRPSTLDAAIALLASHGDQGRVIAGGHSIIPLMKLRFAQPTDLIDLAGIGELKGIRYSGNVLVIGAMTTQAELLASADAGQRVPILAETARQIADPQVRYMGTIGGNVANGDPGNDMPAVMLCLDATYHVTGRSGKRAIKARDFYLGPYQTALATDEILTAVEITAPPAGHGFAYEKLKRKVGDYATAAAAVILTLSGGRVKSAELALTNLADRPVLATAAAAAVIGTSLDGDAIAKAARAAQGVMSPAADARGTVAYRTSVGGVMTARALKAALARAR
jgi:carbon-monoxide dehydrogenase medium subunit